jgi:SEC10/PgrA surface exclusion-like protein
MATPEGFDSKNPSGVTYGVSYHQMDNERTINLMNGLSASQQKELTQYALTLLNSYRKSLGLSEAVSSDETMKMTLEDADYRYNDGVYGTASQANQSRGYSLGIHTPGGALIGWGFNGQNLASFSTDSFTMTDLKVLMFNKMSQMLFDDGESAWGHRNNFINPSESYRMGVAIEKGSARDTNTTFIFDFSDGAISDTATFGGFKTTGSDAVSKQVIDDAQKAFDQASSNLVTAQNVLDVAKVNQMKAMNTVKSAQSALNTAKKALTSV